MCVSIMTTSFLFLMQSRDNFIGLTGYVLLTLRSAASISELASRSVQVSGSAEMVHPAYMLWPSFC